MQSMERSGTAAKRAARSLGLALVLALVPGLAACGSTRAKQPAFVGEIEARNRRMEELFRAADLLGVADVYADDAQLLDPSGERTTGRAEIDQHWSGIEDPVEWRLEIKKIRGSDSLAYEIGTSHLVTRRAGQLHTAVVDFLLIWRRDEKGEWRIALDAYWPGEGR